MSDDYTPTTDDVSEVWVHYFSRNHDAYMTGKSMGERQAEVKAKFDRWFEGEKRRWQSEALREVVDELAERQRCYDIAESAAFVPGETGRQDVLDSFEAILEDPESWLRARAERIENEGNEQCKH